MGPIIALPTFASTSDLRDGEASRGFARPNPVREVSPTRGVETRAKVEELSSNYRSVMSVPCPPEPMSMPVAPAC